MCSESAKAEHTEQLEMPTLGMIFVYAADMRRLVQCRTSYRVLYGHVLRHNFGAGSWGSIAVLLYPSITHQYISC